VRAFLTDVLVGPAGLGLAGKTFRNDILFVEQGVMLYSLTLQTSQRISSLI